MRICYRPAKRIWKRYQAGGAAASKHGNAVRKSNRARPKKERHKILKLVQKKYSGDGRRALGRPWRRNTWLPGKVPVTQFGRMCQKLDIRGRKKIRTHEAANRFLQEEHLADHNARFA